MWRLPVFIGHQAYLANLLRSTALAYPPLDIFAMTSSSFGDNADQPRIIDPSEANWQDAPTPGYFGSFHVCCLFPFLCPCRQENIFKVMSWLSQLSASSVASGACLRRCQSVRVIQPYRAQRSCYLRRAWFTSFCGGFKSAVDHRFAERDNCRPEV
jgi:hypothetical protein